MPLSDVTAMTAKLEAENKALISQNGALQTQVALGKASGEITAATKLPQPKVVATAALSEETQKGLTVMGDYQKQMHNLEAKLAQDEATVATMKLNEGEAKLQADQVAAKKEETAASVTNHYSKIPYFKGFAGSKEIKGLGEYEECQKICDEQSLCKSFSWNQKTKLCFWSIAQLDYDPHYILGVKAASLTEADPHAKWREFPGIKFVNAQSSTLDGTNERACQNKCDSTPSCKSYSFRKDTGFCAYSDTGLAYDDDFNYYEKGEVMTALEMQKAAQLKQERLVMKNQMAIDEASAASEQAKFDKENDAKKAEREAYLNGTPTKAQESALKNGVAEQNRQAAAMFAAQGAAAAEEEEAAAQERFQNEQLAVVAKLSEKESEGAEFKSNRTATKAQLQHAEMAAAQADVANMKAAAAVKMSELDMQTHTQSVTVTFNALEDARKSGDASAISAAQASWVSAKEQLAQTETSHNELVQTASNEDATAKQLEADLAEAKTKMETLTAEIKSNESEMKTLVKAEKEGLSKNKEALIAEQEKAEGARMVALASQEKVAKVKRANANVQIYIFTEKMKDIKTDDERVKLEQNMATERGIIFKADGDNSRITNSMVAAAKKLGGSEEMAQKAQAKLKKQSSDKERADVTNKLAALEEEPVQSPIMMDL